MKFLNVLKAKDLKNKTVLLRVDLNIENEGDISKNPRVLSAAKAVGFLAKKGARVVVLSHRGRPNSVYDKKLTLKPFSKIISKSIKRPVGFANLDEKGLREKIKKSKPGSVVLLENLRFWEGEDKNDKNFAKKLAELGDIYVNDAFAFSHRATASMTTVANFLPSYGGATLEEEVKNLSGVLKNVKKPLIIILGGAKVSDKLGLINNFLKTADKFLIGGAMANTFFAAEGLPVGDSLFEPKMTGVAQKLLESGKIVLPADVKMNGRAILDIGPETVKIYSGFIKKAGTIVWNGPMGKFEDKRFRKETESIAKAVLANKKAKVVIGGGETIASLQNVSSFKIHDSRIFISTGGGAMLEYLGGKDLPGLKALK